ncbi:hypothetical protein PMAYCL1PPCAC_26685 [Pristionchus mayeri]|uniref:Transthyretin-like family protein n=1 Tax=Pristionchus mayeri TaxID=1317129 RepID=A0AAN5I9W8_9BILA|nr:hypothetical protein PMAYCL1PPCAC_26685 [Pristionchus mayeri]
MYFSMIRVFILFITLLHASESIKFQAIGVKGTLLCGEAPTPGVRIRLWDNDMGELVDSPKANSFTDFDGNFEFDDWTLLNDEIDPVIRIAHDCNDGVKPGQRLFKFKIPKSYVVTGKEAPKDKFFNLGTINLEFKPFNEERYFKGDIGKRALIRQYPHKVHRARRHNPAVHETMQNQETTSSGSSSEEDACSSGLCTFSDRKRRNLEETINSDDTIKSEENQESEGCTDGCPIDFSRRKRHEENSADCGEEECPLNIEAKSKNSTKAVSKFGDRDESPEDRIDPW